MVRFATVSVAAIAAIVVALFVGSAEGQERKTLPTEASVKQARIVEKDAAKKAAKQQQKQQQKQATLVWLGEKVSVARNRTWSCQAGLGESLIRAEQKVGALPPSIPYRKWVVQRWTDRASACGARKAEYDRQWNWQAFPSWIISLGVCESGGSGGAAPGHPNWNAEGSSSHGTFYSAFNIGRSRYDGAAHHMGVRGWHEGKGVPTPYEQAMALIGYVRLYGDGFTGRCAGIARSSWG